MRPLGQRHPAPAAAPLLRQEIDATRDPLMVLAERGTRLAPEPGGAGHTPERSGAPLEPGEVVQRIDTLPGWLRVQSTAGARGWLPESELFPLRR